MSVAPSLHVPVSGPITGKEQDIDPTEPLGALAEYYRAFNSRNFQLMELNWSDREEVSMAAPLGGIHRGWLSISRMYRKLFGSTHVITLELHDYRVHEFGEAFLVVGSERGHYRNGAITLDLMIRTSRVFRRVYGRWRQYHVHGSIDDAKLLARLQGLFADRAGS